MVLARARVGAKSEEPGGAVVMLGNDGLESVTRQKRTRVLLLERTDKKTTQWYECSRCISKLKCIDTLAGDVRKQTERTVNEHVSTDM